MTLAVKHVTKSPGGVSIGSEAARSAKLVVDLLIPGEDQIGQFRSPSPLCRQTLISGVTGYIHRLLCTVR